MPILKTYDIFISHAWKYGDAYDRLINLLDNAPYFYYRNYSAPKHKPLHNLDTSDVTTKRQIKEAIIRKIRPVNAVIVISGMYYNHKEWMKFELDVSCELHKPIIAIKPQGNTYVPADIIVVADEVVNWDSSSIVDAIRKYSL